MQRKDVINVLILINRAFYLRAYQIFNPRNAMYISRSNGMTNSNVLIQRDTLINANTIEELTSSLYSEEEKAKFASINSRNKEILLEAS